MAPSRGLAQLLPSNPYICYQCCRHAFTTSAIPFSGHNRWSKIKHDKGKNDAAKNRQRSVFAQEITNASKLYGPDPNSNPRLADIITKAKRDGFAKASIEAAIARGQGKGIEGQKLENVTVEGILPGNVGVVVECETDNKARTMMALRHVLKEAGGTATPSAYLFEKKGKIVFESKPGQGLEQVLDAALDAGATDIEEHEDGEVTVLCEPGETIVASRTISNALGLQIKSLEIIWKPLQDTIVRVASTDAAQELGAFVDDLYDKEPSVSVAMNVDPGSLNDDAWRELQMRLRA